MIIGELLATLGIDSRQFDSKIKSITGQLFSLKNILITVAGGYGLKKLSGAFLDAARESENYRLRLNALLGSIKEGNRLFDEMSIYAARVPFEYREIMSSATQLAGVMRGGVDEVKSWIPLIGDLAAASGLGIQRTTEQIIRMYSAGAASADLFRERGILAMLGFQSGVSYSADETRKKLIEAWLDPQSKFRGLTGEMANTWDGLMSMMSDKWFMLRKDLMEAGTFDFLKAGLKMVNDELNRLKETGKFDAFAKDMGEKITKGFEWILKGAALVGDAFRGWGMIWEGLKMGYAAFSMAIMKGLNGILFLIRKFYEYELKILELLDKIPFLDMDASGVLTGVRLMLKSLDRMENSVEEMEKYWNGVLQNADEHLEQLATTASYYTKTKNLIGDIRKEIENMRISKPKTEGAVSEDIIKYTTEAADNAKKTFKIVEKEADKTFTQNMVESVQNWSDTATNYLNDWAWGAKLNFEDVSRSFGMMITEMLIKTQLMQPWMNWFGGFFGPPTIEAIHVAKGAAFSNGRLLAFDRGGVVNRPMIFPMQGGAAMVGEAGPEGVLPLKRMPGGDLGVQAQGTGGIIKYEIHNHISALDAPSVIELMRRTPQAVLIPLWEARERGAKI